MQERKYVPAPHEDVEQAKPASTEPSATDRTGTEQPKTEQEAAPAVQELPPMTATFKNEGAAKSLQSCPTLCDPIDGSPPGSPFPGILQARTLEWVAISFSNS